MTLRKPTTKLLHKNSFFGFLAFLVLAISAAPMSSALADSDADAESFIDTVATEAVGVLNDKSLSLKDRTDQFADIVIANADMKAIAYFTLGQYRRQANQQQLDEFLGLFNDFTKNFYSTRLAEYTDQQLKVTGSVIPNPKKPYDVIVTSELVSAAGTDPVEVNWRLRKKDGNYKLRDLQVIGVWLALEQRSQFTATIANNNGSFDSLLAVLREQVESGESFSTAADQPPAETPEDVADASTTENGEEETSSSE